MPHLEFVVLGPPVSCQTSDKVKLKAWQAKIRTEAARYWKSPPLRGKLKFLLFNFHEGDTPPLDDHNMVKPIRDALNRLVYEDNRQIWFSETYQIPIDDPIKIRRASPVLLNAYSQGDEFLYIRVEDCPAIVQLPGQQPESGEAPLMMVPHWADPLFVSEDFDPDQLARTLVADPRFEDLTLPGLTRALFEAKRAHQVATETLRTMPRLIGLVPAQQARVRFLELVQSERELDRIMNQYAAEGYDLVKHPDQSRLPAFAANFGVDLLATRGQEGVLVVVKRTRDDLRSDPDLAHHAEMTNARPGWRFDLVVLEADRSDRRGIDRDPSAAELTQMVNEAEQVLASGTITGALVLAWGALEASMRRSGQQRGSGGKIGTQPLTLVRELYAEGDLSEADFHRLEATRILRNAVVHGYPHTPVAPDSVRLILELAHRLAAETKLLTSVAS